MRALSVLLLAGIVVFRSNACAESAGGPAPQIWAGITVNRPLFDRRPTIAIQGEAVERVTIFFNLVNDSEVTIDPELDSTQLLINGKELKDWQFCLRNGPQDNRSAALPPGDFLAFGKQLERYFQKPGRYKVQWKGKRFQSREIEFRVL